MVVLMAIIHAHVQRDNDNACMSRYWLNIDQVINNEVITIRNSYTNCKQLVINRLLITNSVVTGNKLEIISTRRISFLFTTVTFFFNNNKSSVLLLYNFYHGSAALFYLWLNILIAKRYFASSDLITGR